MKGLFIGPLIFDDGYIDVTVGYERAEAAAGKARNCLPYYEQAAQPLSVFHLDNGSRWRLTFFSSC